ncbi:MAG: hypothetical protein GY801_45025 [bacterium]|nr:hypothetical protein [bacterium]
MNSSKKRYAYKIQWHDPRPAHDGPGKITRPLHEIWHPRLVVINQQRLWESIPDLVDIFPDGTVVYYERLWGDFSQPLILWDFPFDRQHFEISLTAVGYTPEEVELRVDADTSGLAADFSQPDWTVTGWDVERRLYDPYKTGKGVPSVVLFFDAPRKPGYYVLKVIFPLILIVIMSWTVFWIAPSESETQISVAVTSILTLIAYRFMVDTMLPNISYPSRMDFFILGSTVQIFFALIQVMVTSSLAGKGREQQAVRIDLWCRFIFPVIFVGLCIVAFWVPFG